MIDNDKFQTAIKNLKDKVEYTFHNGVPVTEELFNAIEWTTGVDADGFAISTTTCPHSEITWTKLKAEMDKVEAEYDSADYARAREIAYPVTKEFIEAYTEKEIDGDSTKCDAYVIKRNKVITDNPK